MHQFKRYFDIGVFLKKDLQLLKNLKTDTAGISFLKEEFRYLLRNREYRWFLDAIGEAISKYLGYKLGLHYAILPNAMRKRISMHSRYWD